MEGVAYDVANQVFKREHVNTGLFKAPTSQITGRPSMALNMP